MKKLFKFILNFIILIVIILAVFSFCTYNLVTKSATIKLQNIGTEMFGGKLLLNRKVDNLEYTFILEEPSGFSNGNMLLIQNIDSQKQTIESEDQNKKVKESLELYDFTISNITINYAINKDNKVNIHVSRDNAIKYIQDFSAKMNEFNKIITESQEITNKDKPQQQQTKKIQSVRSITFINPTILLFVDGEYRNIATIPSFALQYDGNGKEFITAILDAFNHLTNQSDLAVIKMMQNKTN